jgi:hypothetical protein
MPTLTYILLRDSTGFERRFRVPQGTLLRKVSKMQTNERTLTGRADTQEGPHLALHTLQVRVRNVASGADPDGAVYGVLADLRALFALKNPRGAPSNRLTYVDHLGGTHMVKLIGDLEEVNITPYLGGEESWFFVTLSLEEVG